jgi:hypothetical protein
MSVFAYELKLRDFQALDTESIYQIQMFLNSALRAPHIRLLSYVSAVRPDKFEAMRRAQMSKLKHDLARAYMEEEARSLRHSLEIDPAWSMRHYLLSFGQPLRALEEEGDARIVAPSPPTSDEYDETPDYLSPRKANRKYIKVISSYEFKPQTFTWDNPFASLVTGADGRMIVCLDAQRISDHSVRLARDGLIALVNATGNNDEDSRELAQIAHAAMSAREEFYQIRMLILLEDANPQQLLERAERIVQSYRAHISFSPLVGQQRAALEYFSDNPKPSTAETDHPALGVTLPVIVSGLAGVQNNPAPDGIYLGQRKGLAGAYGAKHGMMQRLGPAYLNGWLANNTAYHTGFLGRTGGGKSVAMMAMLGRERAINDVPIVLLEPMGNAPKLARLLAGDPKMTLHRLTWSSIQINPLDWVGSEEAEQTQHLHALLQIMLNRRFDNIEKGLTVSAMREVYRGLSPDDMNDPERVPLLQDFVQALYELKDPQATYIARELDFLYVQGGYAAIFNAPTNLSLGFNGADLYDAQDVAGSDSTNEDFKTILYYTMLSSLIRTARREKQAGRARPRLIAIDEYYAMARNPFLRGRMEILIKTARNLGLGVWFAEQNLATFLGMEVAEAGASSLSGHFLKTNTTRWFIFKQDETEARLVAREFSTQIPESFIGMLPLARQGQAISVLDEQRTYLLDFSLLPSEMEALVRWKPAPLELAPARNKAVIAARAAASSPASIPVPALRLPDAVPA